MVFHKRPPRLCPGTVFEHLQHNIASKGPNKNKDLDYVRKIFLKALRKRTIKYFEDRDSPLEVPNFRIHWKLGREGETYLTVLVFRKEIR